MASIDRRRFLVGSLGVMSAAALASCTTESGSSSGAGGGEGGGTNAAGGPVPPASLADALAAPGTPGLVDEAWYQGRVDEYLQFATTDLDPASLTQIAAFLIRARREPDFVWDPSQVTVDTLADTWEQIDTWQDTRDFRIMYLHWLAALGEGDTPTTRLDPSVIAAIDERFAANRYRYDDPLPADRLDEQWFWSENHILIIAADEYLAGKRLPDTTFAVTGMTGAEHAARARPVILDWVGERAEFGFFEWHSHVYMLKNISPLIMLAELDDDPEIVRAAGMALDLALLDMAAHTHRGTFTASRGRTYKKDKMSARDEDVFSTNKLLFDDTDLAYTSKGDGGATYFCAAARYRPPQTIVDIATADAPGVTAERHGIFVDGSVPVTDDPEAPYGYDFADPANLSFWWSQGAVGMWQVADISLSEAKEHRLLETELLAQVKVLVELNGSDPDRVKAWEQANHAIVNFGHLREANTYAWRGDEVALASVLDHRFGQMRDQVHAWQATIDADALVFTTHPRNGPAATTEWGKDDSPGYWTGEASMPRSAQHERTAIHIYQPAWDATTDDLLWSVFGYRPFTHAYVPQDHFDEVTQDGNWTIARKGGAWIALWSWRTPTWKVYDPATTATRDMVQPFDLVAEGGPDNVWIVEVGEQALDGDFAAWRSTIAAAQPTVERTDDGFTVAWTSPSAGEVTFGSTTPFTVAGEEVAQADFPRHDSRFGTVDRLATTYALASDDATLALDFAAMTRTVG
ncbi:MAG: hypothetical protein KDB36_12740 [Acidimicrobiales bacterium]|nr:hypothetical protein [Acidimicrobiales bacterium]